MSIPFFYMINLVIITRFFFQFHDHPIGRKQVVTKCAIEMLGLLLFAWNYAVILVAGVIVFLNWFTFRFEARSKNHNRSRLLMLLAYLALFSVLFAPKLGIHFNSALKRFLTSPDSFSLLSISMVRIHWGSLHMILFGLLVSMNEAKIFMRHFFGSLGSAPKKTSRGSKTDLDVQEYNRGGVIGIPGRILNYFFVLMNQYSAVDFIVAAKGITRFKELDHREFAEYFLVGTL